MLRPFVESMIGKTLSDTEADEFDILSLMEQPYFASVILNESSYADIQNVTKLPKSISCPDQINETSIILLEDWDKEMDNLPNFLQEKIKASREYENRGKIESPLKEKLKEDEISIGDIPF